MKKRSRVHLILDVVLAIISLGLAFQVNTQILWVRLSLKTNGMFFRNVHALLGDHDPIKLNIY